MELVEDWTGFVFELVRGEHGDAVPGEFLSESSATVMVLEGGDAWRHWKIVSIHRDRCFGIGSHAYARRVV